jgi:hypothetical protein
MNFHPCEADPDVWMRVATKDNGFAYYEYALCYVDDIMFISDKADQVVTELGQYFELREAQNPGKEPQRYLGATIGLSLQNWTTAKNGTCCLTTQTRNRCK